MGIAVGGLLAEQCGLELVGVFCSAAEALVFIENSPPDLLVIDANVAGEHGETWIDVGLALKRAKPEGRLLVINDPREASLPPPAEIEALLLGSVDKNSDWDDLVRMVTRLQEASNKRSPMSNPKWRLQMQTLSPRELRVFQALGLGLLNKEIAHSLGLTLQTVGTYRKYISAKLSLSGSELILAATLYRCTNPP